MTVSLTISETLDGAALGDAIAGAGGQTGVDLGSCTNNAFCPLVDKATNDGAQHLFLSHDAAIDPITNLKVHIGIFGGLTGYTYGGARTAALDYAALKTMGQGSGTSKNNADGDSEGLWMDMDANVSQANQFDAAGRPTLVKIFGRSGTDGIDLPSAFLIAADAMVYNDAGEQLASTPIAGRVGKAGDTVLGDAAHIRMRAYLKNSWVNGGLYQWEYVFSYSFTA